jgi:hypothetical protein
MKSVQFEIDACKVIWDNTAGYHSQNDLAAVRSIALRSSPLLFALALTMHAPARVATDQPRLGRDATSPCPGSAPTAESWRLIEEHQFFLQDPPNAFTGLYRSQGIATDGSRWFFSWQYGLEITDESFHSVLRNSSFKRSLHWYERLRALFLWPLHRYAIQNLVPGIPGSLLGRGLNHIGDIDYYNGIIYASLDTTWGYTDGHVALYNASDLSFTGAVFDLKGSPANPKNDVASWVAVDPAHNRGYGKEWRRGNTINVYNLSDWSFLHTLTLDRAIKRIQGAKVHGDWLYMASDNATQSVYRANLLTGHVEELFRLPAPSGNREVEGIAVLSTHSSHGAREACDDDGVDLYVEMVVDPDRSGQDPANPHLHVSLYHYAFAARGD